MSELRSSAARPSLAGSAKGEIAAWFALVELMSGTPVAAPLPLDAGAPVRAWVVVAAARVWAAAVSRDGARSDRALGELERALRGIADDDPSAIAARAWADLAIAEAALAIGERTVARLRFHAVASGRAPATLRVAATLRIVTLLLERVDLDQARFRCRRALMLAGPERPLLARQVRITGA